MSPDQIRYDESQVIHRINFETNEAISRIHRERNNPAYVGVDCTNIVINVATIVGLGIACAYFFSRFKF
jgi:hypothetical protein